MSEVNHRFERLVLVGLVCVAIVRLSLDVFMISEGLIKLELANALQLEQHAAIRDGFIVLWTGDGVPYEALHHWLFHLPLLISPRIEVVAVCLVVLDFITAALTFRAFSSRFSRCVGATAAAFYLASPVGPILSKHVIATAFVPIVGLWFTLALIDAYRQKQPRALAHVLAAWALLIALNHWHILWAPVVVHALWQARPAKVPRWGLVVASLPLLVLVVRLAQPGALAAFARSSFDGASSWLVDPLRFVRRMILVEPDMHQLLPWFYLLFVLVGWGVVTLIRAPRAGRSGGLVPALLCGPLLLFAGDGEATVLWQWALFWLFAWWAVSWPRFTIVAVSYALVANAMQIWLFASLGVPGAAPEAVFFPLASVAQKEEMLDVLEHELGARADEMATLRVTHPVGEDHDGVNVPANLPGLLYLSECCRRLPPGGDRCLAVTDGPPSLPEGAVIDRQVTRDWLTYTAWRGGGPCESNLRRPLPPAVYLDLTDFSLTDAPSRGPPTER